MEQPTSGQNTGEPTPHPAGDPIGGETASRASSTSMPPAQQQRTMNETMSQLDGYAEKARVALPAAPPGLLNGYMRWAPWIAIVFGAIGVIFSLLLLVFGAVLSPLLLFAGASGVSAGGALFLALAVSLISAALEFVGGYLMLQRRATGWWLLAVGLVVSFLSNLVRGSIIVLIFVALIAYIHLQVKPNYR
jgi:hypothetical protein